MKIHRISPETLITLIHAHLAGKADSTAKEELRFFYIPPVFIQNKRRKSIVVHLNKITYKQTHSIR